MNTFGNAAGSGTISQPYTCSISWSAAGTQSFTIDSLNFVPDVIRVQASLANDSSGAITPVSASTAQFYSTDIFSVSSNLFPGSIIALCNVGSTYNPVFEFHNPNRRSFQGTYNVSATNITTNGSITAGIVVLHFTFVRYLP